MKAGICRNMKEYTKINRNMLEYAGVCKICKKAGIYRNMLEYAGLCKNMKAGI